ncbi:carbamoyltransferase family protein [Pedobacter jejuensis]|uniref:Carbamoyltransferase n=1 Tax=Pedobacter jejuensis TaxID=1268550 RepID=A0A3N0BQ73_9SPHI|nr:carbamoyltransferase C-terminal domain-containing protein [Pedobacter jejuensis]RNL51143.1 carbamoyltransferase [Pedobacter jejuensis]
MYILGINAFHGDSAACIYKDGLIVAAAEEERFRRIKHWAGFPSMSIQFCLHEAGIDIREVDHIAISRNPRANFTKKVFTALKNRLSVKNITNRLQNLQKAKSIGDEFITHFGLKPNELKAEIHNIEHHRTHLASAFFASPFDESAILSIDGFGDFTSTMTAIGKDNKISVLDTVSYPHSLGLFYTALTQFLGFRHYGDEYKVMGLAPYGQAVYEREIQDLIHLKSNGLFELNLTYFTHTKKGVQMIWNNGIPEMESVFSGELIRLLGPSRLHDEPISQRHKNIAASVQKVTEKVIFHILKHLQNTTGLTKICIAGGVAQNSVANGKILQQTQFEQIYIPPAGHDAGTCLGAALWVYNQVLQKPRTLPMLHAYFGSKFNNTYIEDLLNSKNIKYLKPSIDEYYEVITNCLKNEGVVGWFQGRAEFGPRALGHRSILADPRNTKAKDILNGKIKRRESFRPFAPSILSEFVDEYFEQTDDVPFMEKVFKIKKNKSDCIPAVTHVDGTGRLQTVHANTDERYHKLIYSFYKQTGVPILLNTSFNENEPIVNTPEEALDCFLRTKMDMLVMEDIIVLR